MSTVLPSCLHLQNQANLGFVNILFLQLVFKDINEILEVKSSVAPSPQNDPNLTKLVPHVCAVKYFICAATILKRC